MTINVIRDYIVEREGEARLAGHEHLKAELVARMHVNGGRSIEYVMQHYHLTRAQVHAALVYFYENQQALDAAYQQSWSESQAVKSDDFMAEIESRQDEK